MRPDAPEVRLAEAYWDVLLPAGACHLPSRMTMAGKMHEEVAR